MKKLSTGLSLFVVALTMATLTQKVSAQAERKVDPWYQDGLFIHNITYGSINPANIVNIPYSGLNDIVVSYSGQNGKYRAFDDGVKTRLFDANVFGIRKFEKLSFKGNINYSNHYSEDMRWNATVLTSELNPFLLADTLRYDTLTNDARTESFVIDGSVAYDLSNRLTVGVSAKYTVAHKADQSDPRMKANAARTAIMPGINWNVNGTITLGLAGIVEIYHENDKSSVEDNMIGEHNKVYIYKGLGGYEGKDGLGYNRRYDGLKFGGSLNFNFSTNGSFKNFTEFKFVSNSENATDGGDSYSYKGGDFSQTTMALNSRFVLARPKIQHNLIIEASMDNCKGEWSVQKQERDEWKMIRYNVTSTETIHKENDMTAALTYNATFLKSGTPHLSVSATAAYKQVSVKQFPDENHAKYTKLNAGLVINKKWTANKMRFLTEVSGGMNHALKPLDISVLTNEAPLERFYKGYYLPKYTYLSAEDYYASIQLGASYPLALFSSNGWLNLTVDASIRKYSDKSPIFKDTDKKNIGLKLNYTF